MFVEKDDVRLGELHLDIAIGGLQRSHRVRGVIEEREIDTEQFFVIALLRDDLEEQRNSAFDPQRRTSPVDNALLRKDRECEGWRESSSPGSCQPLERRSLGDLKQQWEASEETDALPSTRMSNILACFDSRMIRNCSRSALIFRLGVAGRSKRSPSINPRGEEEEGSTVLLADLLRGFLFVFLLLDRRRRLRKFLHQRVLEAEDGEKRFEFQGHHQFAELHLRLVLDPPVGRGEKQRILSRGVKQTNRDQFASLVARLGVQLGGQQTQLLIVHADELLVIDDEVSEGSIELHVEGFQSSLNDDGIEC